MNPVFDINGNQTGTEPYEPTGIPLDQERAGMRMTDIQFSLVGIKRGWMTQQEGEDWVANGALPSRATAAISLLPAEDQDEATVRFKGAREIERNDPFLPALQAIPPTISDTELDDAFREGMAL